MNLPDWHPILPVPDEGDALRTLATAEGQQGFAAWLTAHQRALRLAEWDERRPFESDCLRHGFDLPHWQDVDEMVWLGPPPPARARRWDVPCVARWPERLRTKLASLSLPQDLRGCSVVILLGGNRSAKSEYCAKRVMQSALTHAGSTLICLSETLDASRENQQSLIWKYLPPELKRLNGTRDPKSIYHINYSKKSGFTLERMILPNGSAVHFKSYTQDQGEIEGFMLGSREARAVGAWADESMPVAWQQAVHRRTKYCGGVMLWSFTPVHGMTPAIKEAVGEGEIVASLPAELLDADRVHVPGCPAGEMPYVQRTRAPGGVVVYFFSLFNPFGTATASFYAAVRDLCAGKPSRVVMQLAYGWASNTAGRAFPNFSAANVVRVANIPAEGTIYQFTDPHGSKPYASIWVLATAGSKPDYYVLRDFPDEATYGPWAETTTKAASEVSRAGWDGDPGPAQRPLGWGIAEYKREWLKLETVPWTASQDGGEEEMVKLARPWHQSAVREWRESGAEGPLRERVQERFMDARFANSKHAAEHGGTCLKWQFEEEQRGPGGDVAGPRMMISEASGKDINHGLALVTSLLAWDMSQPLCPGLNAPRLYVSEEATQVRWALENYTGRGGETGACKEWIDLIRHLAEAEPVHVAATSGATAGMMMGSY